MAVIDFVSRHYEARTGEGRRFIDVPEWSPPEGPVLRIYWKPLTLAEKARLFPAGRLASETDWAECVIMKAEDAAGSPIFPDPKDGFILKHKADQAVVFRIGSAIMAGQTVEDAIKNS